MDMPLRVEGSQLKADDESAVPNGDFDDYANGRFTGYGGVNPLLLNRDTTVDGTPATCRAVRC